MSIANYLTFIRIFVSPLFLFFYLKGESLGIDPITLPYVLLLLLCISEFSDALDGFLARKLNQVTEFGKILDPMADSMNRLSVFFAFTLPPVNLSMFMVFIFLYRDSIISTFRTVCALKGFALAARKSGKIKAFFQAMSSFFIVILLIPYSLGKITQEQLHFSATIVASIAVVFCLYSLFDYIYANRVYMKMILIKDAKPQQSE